jgi:hypothetical protein
VLARALFCFVFVLQGHGIRLLSDAVLACRFLIPHIIAPFNRHDDRIRILQRQALPPLKKTQSLNHLAITSSMDRISV